MKIKPISCLLNTDCLFMSFVTQYELFEVQERSFVMNSLSDLHLAGPGVGSPSLLTVIALLVLHNKLNSEGLLKHGIILNFLLNHHFHFHSSTMWLRPNKGGVDYLNFVKSFHVFEAHCSQLCTFKFALLPNGPAEVSVALATMLQDSVLRYTFSNVNLRLEAVDTSVGCVRLSHNTTNTTPDSLSKQKFGIGYLDTTMLVDHSSDGYVIFILCHLVIVALLSVYFWFKKHVVVAFNLFVINFHFDFILIKLA